MKQFAIIAGLAALALWGCGETKESLQSDTEKNAEVASERAREAMGSIGDAAASATAATTLTPRLKAAITADKELNDGKNHINVDSNEEKVTLDGHVVSQMLKDKAERIVREEMAAAKANQTLVNNLVVGAERGD